jgi:hypothetical protein
MLVPGICPSGLLTEEFSVSVRTFDPSRRQETNRRTGPRRAVDLAIVMERRVGDRRNVPGWAALWRAVQAVDDLNPLEPCDAETAR